MYRVYVCMCVVWTLTQALPGFTECVHACVGALCAFAHVCMSACFCVPVCVSMCMQWCLCTAHNCLSCGMYVVYVVCTVFMKTGFCK